MTFSKIWTSLHGFSSTAWHADTNIKFRRLKTIITPAISHQFPSDQPVQSVVPSKAVSDTSTFIHIFFTSPTLPSTKLRPIGQMEARGFPRDASTEHLCLFREFITSPTLFLNKQAPDWSPKASFWLVHIMFSVTWNNCFTFLSKHTLILRVLCSFNNKHLLPYTVLFNRFSYIRKTNEMHTFF